MNTYELYQDIILDHSSRPRNFGKMEDADVSVEAENPLCGDELTLYLKTSDAGSKLECSQFTGQACAICTASASLLTTKIRNLSSEKAVSLSRQFQKLLQPGDSVDAPSTAKGLGDLQALAGVRNFPMRIKCATLAWHALEQAVATAAKGGGTSRLEVKEE